MGKRSNPISLRPATKADFNFTYEVKKSALGPHIDKTWGWDEDFQHQYHLNDFTPSKIQIVTYEDEDVGWFEFNKTPERFYLVDFVLLPKYQGRGIGSFLISGFIKEAKLKGLPIRLGVLKVNPAMRFYERLGFSIIGESETHFEMEVSPG